MASSVMYRQEKSTGGDNWERLMREREELLTSGCYSQDDPLIREMDRQI